MHGWRSARGWSMQSIQDNPTKWGVNVSPTTEQILPREKKQEIIILKFWVGRLTLRMLIKETGLWNSSAAVYNLIPILECWFKSQRSYFWAGFLLMLLGRQQRTAQVVGSMPLMLETTVEFMNLASPRTSCCGHLRHEAADCKSLCVSISDVLYSSLSKESLKKIKLNKKKSFRNIDWSHLSVIA